MLRSERRLSMNVRRLHLNPNLWIYFKYRIYKWYHRLLSRMIVSNLTKLSVLKPEWNHDILKTKLVFLDFELKKVLPPPPPLGNFADISYLKENFKPHLLRDVCTLCSGALVSDSLLHMLLYQTKEKFKMKV